MPTKMMPDHHWQCNWRMTWTSLRMYVGKRRTLRATIVTILSHMTRDVSVFYRVSAHWRAILICPSICPSVRDVPVLDENGRAFLVCSSTQKLQW